MLAKSIVAAGIRVFGLAIAFIGIRLLLTYFASSTASSPLVPAISFAVTLAICIFLWRFSLGLASLLLPAQPNPEVAATAADIEAVGLNLMGLFFALSGLNRLALSFIQYYSLSVPGLEEGALLKLLFVEGASSAIQLLLGIVLLIGSKPLLGLLRKLRTAGLAKNG